MEVEVFLRGGVNRPQNQVFYMRILGNTAYVGYHGQHGINVINRTCCLFMQFCYITRKKGGRKLGSYAKDQIFGKHGQQGMDNTCG
ncbi:hypothetical protein TNCV_1826091 [Trichonephila clavipes]|nr:hypothetical protein TNCV_1826091 [Trichonephila clavipes]